VLLGGLLGEASHPVSQADLACGHAVPIPEIRGPFGSAGQHGTAGNRLRPGWPPGNGERMASR
jgi:hypothetical protein